MMKPTVKKAAWTVMLLIVLSFITSCLFPEKFDIKININKNGSYSFVYDGILTYVIARAGAVEGKLTAKDERDVKTLEREIKKDPGFKEVRYLGEGRFKVLYKRDGSVNTPMYFLGVNDRIISIVPKTGKQVEVAAMKVDNSTLKMLQDLKMKIDGHVEVTTNGKVLRHNALSEPWFWGFFGAYKWQIKSITDPAPFISIQL